ncbi:hypothetical protein [Isoptericola croceus]|uniref:hypothetical protein n=1 Tax=Isoptericola croceus TaxID=3031406 RepID=UPI0023F7B968|nr:hypothetical protein [Isoptericola croceus]
MAAGDDVPWRVLVPVSVGLVLAVGGALVAWDAGTEVVTAHRLATDGVATTAHGAEGSGARGRPVEAVVDLPDGDRRLRLDGATAADYYLAPATLRQEVSGAWRPVDSGPYAGTFDVLHEPGDVEQVMAASDVERITGDEVTRTIAVVSTVVSVVATAALALAAVVGYRRASRRTP